MIFRKNGAVQEAIAVTNHPWREFVDEFDTELESAALAESEEAVVDLWLEDPMSFMDNTEVNPEHAHTGSMMRRVATGGMGLQRMVNQHKTASSTNWDDEFANAKAHAASVLSQLGKH